MTVQQDSGQPAPDSSPEAPNGLGEQGVVAPETNVTDEGVEQPEMSKSDKRFNDLIGKLKGESEARKALELELAELRGRVSEQGEKASADPWDRYSEEELLSISAQNEATPEQRAEALRRYHARINSKIAALTEDKEAVSQFQAEMNRTWEVIRENYGAEVDNATSPLRQKATEVFGQYREKYGPDVVDRDPRYQLMAFEVAHAEVANPANSKIAELEAEIARLKQGSTIEAAGNLASSGVARTNQNLAKGTANDTAIEISKKLLAGPPVM